MIITRLSVFLASTFFLVASVTANILDSSLSAMFTNVTTPGALNSNMNGSLIGGSVYARTPNSVINPIVISPPQVSAGCGGISATLGGFSYVSATKLMDFFRKVIQQAVPVAFQLALKQMFPAIAQIVSDFNTFAQRATSMSQNSCAMATGLVQKAVDEVASAVNQTNNSGAQSWSLDGTKQDALDALDDLQSAPGKYIASLFSSKTTTGSTQSSSSCADPNLCNVAWKALTAKNNTSGFSYELDSDPTKSAEIVMSLVGTSIVAPANATNMTDTTSPPNAISFKVPSLTFNDLIKVPANNKLPIYVCDEPVNCLYPTQELYTYYGIEGYVRSQLYGTNSTGEPLSQYVDGTNSILNKLRSESCTNMSCYTTSQINFINSTAQVPLMAYLKKSQHDTNFLVSTTNSLIDLIVADAAVNYGDWIVKKTKAAWIGTNIKYPPNFDENMRALQESINLQRTKRDQMYKDLAQVLAGIDAQYASSPELQGWRRMSSAATVSKN
jgi:conjugative transfer pilus assembly protein TraH